MISIDELTLLEARKAMRHTENTGDIEIYNVFATQYQISMSNPLANPEEVLRLCKQSTNAYCHSKGYEPIF